jgi:hypothetical protein
MIFMRVIPLLASVALLGCGEPEEPPFSDEGGSLDIEGCNYAVTTRSGADRPRVAGETIGNDPTPRLVHLGVMGDPRTSMVAQWRTADETTTAGSIRYGAGADLSPAKLTKTVKGIQFGYRATGTEILRMHQAHLCGLQAGTAYSYQVGTEDHWSPVYTFHTPPDVEANPDAEVLLADIGDSRNGYDIWAQFIALLQERSPDVILFSGDAILFGITQGEWDEFLAIAEPLFATVPVIPTNGNHEGNALTFYSQFALPGDQQNFGLTYGFSRVFVANDLPEDPNALATSSAAAIDADFTDHASTPWKILMHHRPMWSTGAFHADEINLRVSLRDAWGPVIDKHHVDLVLNGHEHSLEITKPLVGGVVQPSNANATVYVVAGGAGAPAYGFTADEGWTDYREEGHSAGIIHVRQTQLTLDLFRVDGTTVPAGFTKTKL